MPSDLNLMASLTPFRQCRMPLITPFGMQLRVVYCYLVRLGRSSASVEVILGGMQALQGDGFHCTITIFWIQASVDPGKCDLEPEALIRLEMTDEENYS
jgi:hypothetical protein